jgi:hypothetical protein
MEDANGQLQERLDNEINDKLQFIDYAEAKILKHIGKNAKPASQHFAINAALLNLEETSDKNHYVVLFELLILQLNAYLELPESLVADAFREEIVATVKQLNDLVSEVEVSVL